MLRIKLLENICSVILIIVFSIVLSGCGTLRKAAQEGDLAAVKQRVEKGEDINDGRLYYGYGSLYIAANEGHYEVVEYLISKGADVNAHADGFVLEYSRKAANDSYDYRISRRLRAGDTPLTSAINGGKRQWDRVVALLLEKGANPNGKQITFNAEPVFWSHGQAVGVDIDMTLRLQPRKESIHTALTLVTIGYRNYQRENNHEGMVKCKSVINLLLKFGADKRETSGEGYTAYDIASMSGLSDLLDILKPN